MKKICHHVLNEKKLGWDMDHSSLLLTDCDWSIFSSNRKTTHKSKKNNNKNASSTLFYLQVFIFQISQLSWSYSLHRFVRKPENVNSLPYSFSQNHIIHIFSSTCLSTICGNDSITYRRFTCIISKINWCR
jgi:hypothetical protein